MKILILTIVLMVSNLILAYSGGIREMNLVNIQEFGSDQINSIAVRYNSERITIFQTDTNSIIVKEYMNRNNSDFSARITNLEGSLTVEAGGRPFQLVNNFNRRAEIHVPSDKNISIRTSSGRIESNGIFMASSVDFQSSSGRISVNEVVAERVIIKATSGSIHGDVVTGDTTIETSSGDIDFSAINGNVSANSSSGSINLGLVGGTINARSSSGSFHSTLTGNAGDITITSSSGSVRLDVPRDFSFNFSSRTSSGRLNTPFSDRLFSPINDRNSVQGFIGTSGLSENQNYRNININTNSGSININWAD